MLSFIDSAVLTFIGYKKTDRQTDKQSIYIYRYLRGNCSISLSCTFTKLVESYELSGRMVFIYIYIDKL